MPYSTIQEMSKIFSFNSKMLVVVEKPYRNLFLSFEITFCKRKPRKPFFFWGKKKAFFPSMVKKKGEQGKLVSLNIMENFYLIEVALWWALLPCIMSYQAEDMILWSTPLADTNFLMAIPSVHYTRTQTQRSYQTKQKVFSQKTILAFIFWRFIWNAVRIQITMRWIRWILNYFLGGWNHVSFRFLTASIMSRSVQYFTLSLKVLCLEILLGSCTIWWSFLIKGSLRTL